MTIVALGINHKTASVDLRERVAFSPEQLDRALQQLTMQDEFAESVIVSTCNRTEIYCSLESGTPEQVLQWLAQFHQLDSKELAENVYSFDHSQAIYHLMKVACGLDSLVLGEPQILGQIKQAYASAKKNGGVGVLFERLFQKTFSVAKQVRTETNIGASAVSVAYAAVNLAKHIYGKLDNTRVLLIGAGETIELVARHIHQHSPQSMTVANRTIDRARNLADEFAAGVISLAQLPEQLPQADIVISSTASTLPIIGKGVIEQALKKRKNKPMLLIDIAVPRDIESQVAELDNAYLYSVDDLQAIVSENMATREQAAKEAEQIITARVSEFDNWLKSLDSVGLIRDYRNDVTQTKEQLLERAMAQLASGKEPEKIMVELANKLTNRLMHAPTKAIKDAAEKGEVGQLAQMQKMLGINQE
ncbi:MULTISPECIES: glutamyl-tRNA reductase [Pseudoalteromonas]|uniref:Glutamyl-tRNA reductase n=1 Tax=Pseudoalteromonas ruthenica TaxID=151081 RepID=A0A0F4PQD8_9GAMM|nr:MULTISPECIES: glutamyl-tRNA reductase [Pseudoalteromonas]KJY96451.1 glutamyl-tRNA reductase [Pseudoalteromonas ruthenica]KJY97994.1 glutamyl-tRNA reductase [Pseudoalteromonas ruthenica]MCF2863599.1 glutamyl-tRNA reductase [Pseudoalteromonas sp. CNAT2-18]MCG7546079.1 glutamyl-tRNA reductase [Pseudoalteromonas sp. MM17-2]MCG7558552.1 glutamyl-tRNA reductase [Pseudoalteromonas sp. CNAT2-18.1]|tara:strand:- start:335 stop:1591 length:1257 start_codon:yes stop_codon:yes gene_type:complete